MKKESKNYDEYYRAMLARDSRFDGKFFVGVKTTGIYCRPICPAKPKRENVEFFSTALLAEKAGYRPCLRCRPESAPGNNVWIGKSAVVKRAIKVLHDQDTMDFDEDAFAALFGVSARHLRRLFIEEIGKTPKQLAFLNRLNLARKLITETTLSMTEVAFASGFNSIRRFNSSFKERFKKSPSEIRRIRSREGAGLTLTLSYRPPFDYAGLLHFYKSHQMGRLEWFDEDKMFRLIEMNGHVGTIAISNLASKSQIILEIDIEDTSVIHGIISRVRHMFDLDSDPVIIANSLEVNKDLKKILKKHTGIRLPSGWDPFEVAIATILGQLVSIEQGRRLVNDLINMCGRDSGVIRDGEMIKLFPSAEEILKTDITALKTTQIRKQTVIDFCKAIVEKKVSLEATQDVEEFMKNIMTIKGIGRWTADYMALKVLRHTDAFPGTDLILKRVLEIHPEEIVSKMSPWRGYAAALFWREYHGLLKK